MMEEDHRTPDLQRLLSDESGSSALSSDSCEYYHTEIFGLLPSSQKIHPEIISDQDEYYLQERDRNISAPLKTLPVCMQDKRDIRDRQHLQRRNIGYWDSWRRSQEITRRRMKEHVSRAVSGLLLWRHTLHKVEGQFGAGVKAYFVFLRYLLCLNLLYCAIIGGCVLTPALVYRQHENSKHQKFSFTDIFNGSGFLETSPVFHSFYTPGSQIEDSKCLNTPILFLLGMTSVLFLSLIMVVRRTVVGYKHSWLTGNRFSSNFCYEVFCGWDFCIQNPQSASLKHSFIRNTLKMDLEEQMFHQRVQLRSLRHWVRLVVLRVILNILVLLLLAGSFYLIYYAIQLSQDQKTQDGVLSLMLKYLPPITMTSVNYLVPHFFSKISQFEDYSLTAQLNLTLIRSIFLKLASLGIYLLFFIRGQILSSVDQHRPSDILCAENEFGKEMYRLIVFNLLESLFNAFCVAYPRTLLVERCSSSALLKMLGKQQFEIPLNVLDLVSSQTVTWVGVFYCPLLPAISAFRLLLLFYLKKFTLLRCCVPAQRMFRATSSSVLFHFMLLLGLFMSVVTLVFNINRFALGGCGPFKDRGVFNVTGVCTETLPDPARKIISYISSEAFAFALILAEVVILTSYVSRGRANRKAIERLKDMLVMCSSDKRFLVKEHSTILRRQRRTR